MKYKRLFVVHLFFTGFLLGIIKVNVAQTQNTFTAKVKIDTVYLKAVKSSHFKIRLPQNLDISAYEDLFNTYGELKIVQIKGKKRRFLGNFNNISRAKYVNNSLNQAGIANTKIILFKTWIPPVIVKKKRAAPQKKIEKEAVSQNNTFGENSTKKIKEANTNPFPARPKKQTVSTKPSAEKNYIKAEEDTELIKQQSPEKIDENNKDQFILILPKVSNPEVYLYVLKDLGTVEYKQLPNEQWYYYVGFFKDANKAKAILPKIKERGFTKSGKVSSIKNAEKVALTMYPGLPPITAPKLDKKVKPVDNKKADKALFYSIELPPVGNPEIYFTAFEDVGRGFSEIAPNGKGVYYIGQFQTEDLAGKKINELKQRGLSNGTVVRFENEKRVDAYSEIYVSIAEEEALNENVKKLEAVNKIATHPNGIFQIRLKLVENPDVLKAVFKDVGKLKIGYFDDDSEYYFMGNYLFQEEAEKVIEQLRERGLTQFNLLNVMAAGLTPNVFKAKVRNVYKINLGFLTEKEQSLLRPYGTLTSNNSENETTYYLGDYPTQKVANIIAEVIKEVGFKKSVSVEFFTE